MDVSMKCIYCHQDFNMTDCMVEREVFVPEKLILTVLVCSHCQNEVVAQVDTDETLKVYHQHLVLLKKIGERKYYYGKPTASQLRKEAALNSKLQEMRQELCGKYNHTSYQFDGKEHKLDIHVPSMKISEE